MNEQLRPDGSGKETTMSNEIIEGPGPRFRVGLPHPAKTTIDGERTRLEGEDTLRLSHFTPEELVGHAAWVAEEVAKALTPLRPEGIVRIRVVLDHDPDGFDTVTTEERLRLLCLDPAEFDKEVGRS